MFLLSKGIKTTKDSILDLITKDKPLLQRCLGWLAALLSWFWVSILQNFTWDSTTSWVHHTEHQIQQSLVGENHLIPWALLSSSLAVNRVMTCLSFWARRKKKILRYYGENIIAWDGDAPDRALVAGRADKHLEVKQYLNIGACFPTS